MLFQYIILGILQGITEFVPISSSGHLVVAPIFFGWEQQPLVFDTTIHLGTALAVVIYFWKDLWRIFLGFLKDIVFKRITFAKYSHEGKYAFYILIGCIPAVFFGFFLEELIETSYRGLMSVGTFLILGSLLMYLAEKSLSKREHSTGLNTLKAFFIGLLQSFALFPGVSRSGSTISGGMLSGLNREEATRFSFLLSVPVVVGAGIFKLVSTYQFFTFSFIWALVIGFIVSFFVGLLSIKFMLSFVKRFSLDFFIGYRVVLAVIVFFMAFLLM